MEASAIPGTRTLRAPLFRTFICFLTFFLSFRLTYISLSFVMHLWLNSPVLPPSVTFLFICLLLFSIINPSSASEEGIYSSPSQAILNSNLTFPSVNIDLKSRVSGQANLARGFFLNYLFYHYHIHDIYTARLEAKKNIFLLLLLFWIRANCLDCLNIHIYIMYVC